MFDANRSHRIPALFLTWMLAASAVPAAVAEAPSPVDFSGVWQGTLEAGEHRLRLVFHLSESEGRLEATIDSPDQGATGIPVATVETAGDALRLDVRVLAAEYEGRLIREGTAIEGEWRQSGMELPLTVERENQAP